MGYNLWSTTAHPPILMISSNNNSCDKKNSKFETETQAKWFILHIKYACATNKLADFRWVHHNLHPLAKPELVHGEESTVMTVFSISCLNFIFLCVQ